MANRLKKVQVVLGQHETKATNLITEEMQQLLRPLNFWRNLFLYPTYRIKNNIIRKNSKITNIISFIFHFTIILIWFKRLILIMCETNIGINNQIQIFVINICKLVSYLIVIIGFMTNFTNSLTQRENSIKLALELQKMTNFIKFDRKHFRKLILRNWIYSLIDFLQFIVHYLFQYVVIESFSLNFFVDLSLLIVEVNMVCAIRQLVLIEDILKSFKKKVLDEGLTRYNEACNDTFNNLKRIEIILELYQKVFQDLVILFITFFKQCKTLYAIYLYLPLSGSNGLADFDEILHRGRLGVGE